MKQNKYAEIFSGIGLGMLVGLIIGLSVSHIVGIVLGALTSLLASFFGLTAVKEDVQSNVKLHSRPMTIIYFSLSTFAFILIGIYLRTHNVLSPSIKEQKEDLIEMGLKSEDIGKMLLKIRYNLALDSHGDFSNIESTINTYGTSTSLFGVQLKAADSLLASPSYTYNEVAEIFKSEQGDMLRFYNTINLYVKDTSDQKDILTSTLKLMKGK